MATLTVYGSSDDLVEIAGVEGGDEFNCDGSWSGVIVAPNGDTALLYVDYRRGTWSSSLALYEEGYKLPEWDVKITGDGEMNDYSTYTEITVPDGTKIIPVDED